LKKKSIIVAAVVTALSAALGTFVVRSLMGDGAAVTFDKVLVRVAEETNKALPMMVDKETRLDGTFAGPGNRFTYSYTLVGRTSRDLDTAVLKDAIRPKILANYRSHEQMKNFRDHDVELHYQYKDKNGVYITEIVISPKDF
jgi:hypothetical protein